MKSLEALEKFDKLIRNYHNKIGLNENDLLGFSASLQIIEKEVKALEIIKKYFELTETDDEYEFFKYGLHDKQYISSRSSLCIQPEEFELLKEVFNEDA